MATRGRAASLSSELVLIVDDDKETRQLYAESLNGFGLRVDAARDGAEALSKSLAGPSVICISGSHGSSGRLEFCRSVRQNPRTRHIPLIAVIDSRLPGDWVWAREAGVDSILTTPCPPESLGTEIRRVLRRAREVRRLPAESLPATAARLDALRARVNRRFRTFLKARIPDRKP